MERVAPATAGRGTKRPSTASIPGLCAGVADDELVRELLRRFSDPGLAAACREQDIMDITWAFTSGGLLDSLNPIQMADLVVALGTRGAPTAETRGLVQDVMGHVMQPSALATFAGGTVAGLLRAVATMGLAQPELVRVRAAPCADV